MTYKHEVVDEFLRLHKKQEGLSEILALLRSAGGEPASNQGTELKGEAYKWSWLGNAVELILKQFLKGSMTGDRTLRVPSYEPSRGCKPEPSKFPPPDIHGLMTTHN